MENSNTPCGDMIVKPKRGRPRKYSRIDQSNVQSIGSPPGFSITHQSQIRQKDNNKAMVGEQPHFNNDKTPSGGLMVKPKRGRPRKYSRIESNVQSSGSSPGFSMNQPHISQTENAEAMIGQEIHGVVDVTFKDGFLISVKVENSDTILRGVVFKPGRCVPLSADNDVAPHLPMIKREAVHPHASARRGHIYTVGERRDNGDRTLVPLLTTPVQLAAVSLPLTELSLVPVTDQPHQLDISAPPDQPRQLGLPPHPKIPPRNVVPVVIQPPVVPVRRPAPHLRGPLPRVNSDPM